MLESAHSLLVYRVPSLLSLVVASVLCGGLVPLEDKVFGASQVVELTVTFEGMTKPVVTGGPPTIPLTLTAPCLRLARKQKQVKVLAFFDAQGKQLVGLEQGQGEGTDLDPGYPSLVAAVHEARQWKDERMRAVGPEQLWAQPKKALASDNPYLRRFAAAFLKAHGAADVVDAAWGPPGSPERKKHEPVSAAVDACSRK